MILYLKITRPDLSYAVQVLSQFLESPKQSHSEADHHVLRYLKWTSGQDLFFSSKYDLQVKGICDVDWVARLDARKSVIGYWEIHQCLGNLRSSTRFQDHQLK